MDAQPLHFIGEAITVEFDDPPTLEKNPHCPDRFIWREETYTVAAKLGEWQDYTRRGRMASNMRPAHASRAQQRGSWGVGRLFFRVQTGGDRIFDLYYDRAPQDADRRKGNWFLYRELAAEPAEDSADTSAAEHPAEDAPDTTPPEVV